MAGNEIPKLSDYKKGEMTVTEYNAAMAEALKKAGVVTPDQSGNSKHDGIIIGGNIVERTQEPKMQYKGLSLSGTSLEVGGGKTAVIMGDDHYKFPNMDANGDGLVTGGEIEDQSKKVVERYGEYKGQGVKSWLGDAEKEIAQKLKASGMAINAKDYQALETTALNAVLNTQIGGFNKETPDITKVAETAFKEGFKQLEEGHKLVAAPVMDANKAAEKASIEKK